MELKRGSVTMNGFLIGAPWQLQVRIEIPF